MPDTPSPKEMPDAKPAKAGPGCLHTWETAAPYRARCRICGFVVPITTEEV